MYKRKFSASVVATLLLFGVMSVPGSAAADVNEVETGIVVGSIFAAVELTSLVSSAVYLGKKKPLPMGWQVFSYTASGLSVGGGLYFAIEGNQGAGILFASVGVLSLTLSILAATSNKPKKPTVAFTPVMLRDIAGAIVPGFGFSAASF